ncbi:hypothetical protein [Nannocystis radixulma]|uniref:Uncharacterized protein n=1 Tax=Nannocystis radixulma TaxID=2995305 RepID=A0ABT5B997_9BACT|nr:hypothetical protein [Nannocystis radixulma]MDC0669576.1 hypothetical protein [Nannocystis radixulma]
MLEVVGAAAVLRRRPNEATLPENTATGLSAAIRVPERLPCPASFCSSDMTAFDIKV